VADALVSITAPGDEDPKSIVGLGDEQRAFAAIIRHAWNTATPQNCLFFGWPGSAKTSFAETVVASANRGDCKFHFVNVKCNGLVANHDVDATIDQLRDLGKLLGQYEAAVVILDEVDAIAGRRVKGTTWYRTTDVVMHMLTDPNCRRSVFCCVTNHPALLDPPVHERLDLFFYFAPPDLAMMTGILAQQDLPAALATRVAQLLYDRADSMGAFYTGRALVNACRRVRQLLGPAAWTRTDAADVAEDVAMYANIRTRQELVEFEHEYGATIRQARRHTHDWRNLPSC